MMEAIERDLDMLSFGPQAAWSPVAVRRLALCLQKAGKRCQDEANLF